MTIFEQIHEFKIDLEEEIGLSTRLCLSGKTLESLIELGMTDADKFLVTVDIYKVEIE